MATVLSDVAAFRAARTLDEAYATLDDAGDAVRVVAGGTDVMVQLLGGQIAPRELLHIGRIPGLDRISAGDRISLGALVTHRAVTGSELLSRAVPALAQAAGTVGGWQTQAVGTVVGNVCNASPAADTIPPLLVADAVVHLASSSGERTLQLTDFVLGRRSTAARPNELVTALDVEACAPGTGEVYLKAAPRTAMEVAVVGLAVRLRLADGAPVEARVATGAVSPVPHRHPDVETVLVESGISAAGIAEAAALLSSSVDPIDDPRATASYRRKAVGRMLGRAVELARQRALED